MCQFEKPLTFQTLLDYCSDPKSLWWQRGWREFIKRYKKYIYSSVTHSCLKYKLPRLQRQLSEVVNDIFDEVAIQLCKNNCRALREYRARDNEKMFRAWLAIICNRTSSDFLQRHFIEPLVDSDIDNLQSFIRGLELDLRWQLYEDYVNKLRNFHKKQKRNLERDINIFQLYFWEGFSPPMLSFIPCLKNIGPRVVDNVVNRMRSYLRQSRNL